MMLGRKNGRQEVSALSIATSALAGHRIGIVVHDLDSAGDLLERAHRFLDYAETEGADVRAARTALHDAVFYASRKGTA